MKTSQIVELEGTWEEILAYADKLTNRRVRLIILPDEPATTASKTGHSTAESLLKYAGSWEGDDLEECLQLVYDTRGRIEF